MNNRFTLTESEKERILNMHRKVIEEQSTSISKGMQTAYNAAKHTFNKGKQLAYNTMNQSNSVQTNTNRPAAINAYNTIKRSMDGVGTNEKGVLQGVLMIKTLQDYNTVLPWVKKLNYPTIMAWIGSDMNYGGKSAIGAAFNALSKIGIGSDDRKMLEQMSAHLIKFNKGEVIWNKN